MKYYLYRSNEYIYKYIKSVSKIEYRIQEYCKYIKEAYKFTSIKQVYMVYKHSNVTIQNMYKRSETPCNELIFIGIFE